MGSLLDLDSLLSNCAICLTASLILVNHGRWGLKKKSQDLALTVGILVAI